MNTLQTSARRSRLRASKGRHAVRWIETHCVYTAGQWIGRRVRLLGWEKTFITFVLSLDPETRLRLYRWVLLGIPKKNGKTELAAWLGLYLLVADGELAPLVACAASSDEQADMVFGAAKRCVELSPTLSDALVCYNREIVCPGNHGRLIRVSSKAGTKDGLNLSAVVIDEFHELTGPKGRDLHTILTNGIGAREQPLILQLTTAGYDEEGTICGQHYQLGLRLAQDPGLDPGYLFWWYEPPRDEAWDYRDHELWRRVNPSWGVTLPRPEVYLEDQLGKKTETEFKRYFLNAWTLAEDVWLPDGAWKRQERSAWGLDRESPLLVGVDGSLKQDSFAVVAYQRRADLAERPVTIVRAWVWENPYPVGHRLRAQWKLSLDEPFNKLRALRDEFPVPARRGVDGSLQPGPAFGYDPRIIEYGAQVLADEGLHMVEVPQTDERMCPASELVYTEIMEGTLFHDGDPDFQRQVHSAVPKDKPRGWRLTKPRGSRRKIDAPIALVMAAHLGQTQPEEEGTPNVW